MEPGEARGASCAISPPISTTRRSSVQSWRTPSAISTGTPSSDQMSKTKSGVTLSKAVSKSHEQPS
eukprot:7196660-Alexandrium_andersonii.AAC.1